MMEDVFATLPPPRRRLVLTLLAALTAVIVVVGTIAVVRAVRGERADGVPAAQRVAGPVLLVPGYGGSVTSLQVLARAIESSGRTATVVALPGDGTGDLRAQAQTLAAAARQALSGSSANSVDVVGYSAGGVVARLWAREYGGNALARRIVTLGSPQHGTQLASLGASLGIDCPLACQQLSTDSTLLADLNTSGESSSGPRYVSIWTTRDQVVVPPESARLDGALNLTVQSVCTSSAVDHGGLPTDPVVTAIVLAELSAAAPVTFTASDCARLSSSG